VTAVQDARPAALPPTDRPLVIHLGPDSRGGGGMAAVMRSMFASSLARRYRLVAISTHRPTSAVDRVGVFAVALAKLTRLVVRTPPPRLVHVHATVRGSLHRKAIVVALARRAGAPVLLHFHAGPGDLETFNAGLGPARRRLFAHTMRTADAVVSVSAASARVLEQRFGAPRVTVLDNPLPGPIPPPRVTGAASPGAEPEILYLGGFANAVKGGHVLLDAMPRLRALCPTARLTLAGPGEPPRSLPDGASWVGWLDGPSKVSALERAAVVVLPSTSEGLPMALLEAMAHGAPIVATRVGAIPDVLRDEGDGVLVDAGDPVALGDALGALAGDLERQARLGAAARERAAAFAPDRIADRLATIYDALLARDSSKRA
jgi:glycosyltransferase involved in cell wall biosynthesis